MNKSLETEYKASICAELPDLWGKIEAKLDAQDAENTKTNVTEFPKAATSTQNDNIKKIFADAPVVSAEKTAEPVKRKPKIRWQYFGVIAAAALCMLVVIPALSNMKNASGTSAPMSEGSPMMTAEPAAAGDAADMAEDNAATIKNGSVAFSGSVASGADYGDRGGEAAAVSDGRQTQETLGVADASEWDVEAEAPVQNDAESLETMPGVGSTSGWQQLVDPKLVFFVIVPRDTDAALVMQMAGDMGMYEDFSQDQNVYRTKEKDCYMLVLTGKYTEQEADDLTQELLQREFVTAVISRIYDEHDEIIRERYTDRNEEE